MQWCNVWHPKTAEWAVSTAVNACKALTNKAGNDKSLVLTNILCIAGTCPDYVKSMERTNLSLACNDDGSPEPGG